MNEFNQATPEDDQNQENKSPLLQIKPDQEKEQMKNEILKLKETLSQTDSFRQRAINAETKITSLQESNATLSQQINNLTIQNSQLLNEIVALRNQKTSNLNENIPNNYSPLQIPQVALPNGTNIINNDIQQLQKNLLTMQENYLQEIAFRDDLIERMRANIKFNNEYQTGITDTVQKKQKSKQQLKQQKNIKQTITKKKKSTKKNNIVLLQDDDSDSSSKTPDSPSDQQLLEQKYLKKKNKLTLMKQQYEELEEESYRKVKKTKEDLEDVRQKFHLLKKKYVDLKEDFASLQTCYQAVVQKAETLSIELQKTNNSSKNHHHIDNLPKITIEKQYSHTKMNNPDEKYSRDKYQEMKKRAEKAEENAYQMQCFIKLLASNEKNFNKLNLNNQNIIDQLEALGIRMDRLEKRSDYKNTASNQRKKSNDYPNSYSQPQNQIDEYPNQYSQPKNQTRVNPNQYILQRNKTNDRQRSNSPPKKRKSVSPEQNSHKKSRANENQDFYPNRKEKTRDFQDSSSSPKRRSSSVRKETRKLPQWLEFQDI